MFVHVQITMVMVCPQAQEDLQTPLGTLGNTLEKLNDYDQSNG